MPEPGNLAVVGDVGNMGCSCRRHLSPQGRFPVAEKPAMKRCLVEKPACPECRGGVAVAEVHEENPVRILRGTLRCKGCAKTYPVEKGVPLAAHDQDRRGLARRGGARPGAARAQLLHGQQRARPGPGGPPGEERAGRGRELTTLAVGRKRWPGEKRICALPRADINRRDDQGSVAAVPPAPGRTEWARSRRSDRRR